MQKVTEVQDQNSIELPSSPLCGHWQALMREEKKESVSINAAARMNGLSYSRFMHGLKLAEVDINRKMLAELAVNDAEGFASLAELAKSKL